MNVRPSLDQATLKSLLHYDPDTGIFTWLWRADARPQWNGRYAGKVAGTTREVTSGCVYRYICINGLNFAAHRLAFLYMEGRRPTELIDHEDTDGLNNRWINLREANESQNGANAEMSRANTSGFKGASFHKGLGKFRAMIKVHGHDHHLGYHDTAEAAHAAYMQAATAMQGEFARAA